ncbi:MAG: hypothetical protein PSV17_08685 [Methylotenera sp.]|uniref:hypothetical protein n=1 Tax=Methylotenera sp. TaxID=2051956 RepID=UPI0024877E01|nr:hypothetical protein [Methylotenera sp.]MDI1309492.1 hypothetical protein [Methylotenera sp.]
MASAQKIHSVAAYDNAPFFEKALKYAVQNNVIDQARLVEIINDAATGSLQIAEYFDESIHLRKNLETSMKRMVSLVSLYLEDATDGELDKAAQLLKDKPFRALSRGGSQMLKALYNLPEDEHFGSIRLENERDFLKKGLNKELSVIKYRQSFKECEHYKHHINLATWLVKKLGASTKELSVTHAPVEHVIRTSILFLTYGTKKALSKRTKFPDETVLFEIFSSIRREWALLGDVTQSNKFLEDVPEQFQITIKTILQSIQNEDIPKIVNDSIGLDSVLHHLTGSKYFYIPDQLNEVSRFDKRLAGEWVALTGDIDTSADNEDLLLLTLFLCVAAGIERKTKLKVFEAKKAVLNIREHGLLQNEVLNLIKAAPHDDVKQLTSLWDEFIDEAAPYLLDSSDENLHEVIVYLTERCNIHKTKK